jgi:N-methylhydantoinase A
MRADRSRDVELRSILRELTDEVLGELDDEGVRPSDARIGLYVDCRYEGQSHEVRVPVDGGPSFALVAEAFHAAHDRRYGFARWDAPVQAVTFRAGALGPAGDVRVAAPRTGRPEPAGETLAGSVRARVYERATLGAGTTIAGPALVREPESTTWIDEGSRASVHDSGALVIEVRR